jgi:hypothetical protein
MEESTLIFHSIGCAIDGALSGQMFGKPCFKVNGRAFICLFKECMVFKLSGVDRQEALSWEGSLLFDPSGKGRPMKEWVQVSVIHKNQWSSLANAAVDYIRCFPTK